MKLFRSALVLLLAATTTPAMAVITRQECLDQGGEVVGDIGNGNIFRPDYVCPSTGEAPTDSVTADEGQPMAIEGEVCCGGTGSGVPPPVELPNGETPCLSDSDCPPINCFVAPCDLNVCVDGFCELQPAGSDVPEDATLCSKTEDCPVINCFAAPCDVNVCVNGFCVLEAAPLPEDDLIVNRPTMTRQECTEDYNGTIVGDIGDGAIHRPGYICESNGQPPIGTVVAAEGEPIAIEGEVCCGPPGVEIPTMTRMECTEDYNGTIVGDIGDGAIHRPGYICESNGEPPIGEVIPSEGEPIAIEGEVCCGPAAEMLTMTRTECTEFYGGTIVGDIGNGAIHRPDYICESNGEPPLGTVIPSEGEPIAREGEVCCGASFSQFTMTREECTEDYGGIIVGDIGDGAIHRPDYVCESDGQPPIGEVIPSEGEPIATEGEVCCGFVRPTMTRAECTDVYGGTIVADIGDGTMHRPDYICECNGQPPIGMVIPLEGEPIADEGEVCCGPPGGEMTHSVNKNATPSLTTDESMTDADTTLTENELKSGAISASNVLFTAVATICVLFL